MLNPYSAVSRIKNQLAYRFGLCIINHRANGGGYLSLIYKLYKIKKEYFQEKKLYTQSIKIFPNLAYPDIKTLNDYNDSVKIKFHLSYMMGQVLIQADKNKLKGGYLTLFKKIKQTYKDYKIIKQVLDNFNITSPMLYNAINDNKDAFIKNIDKIESVLRTHKDYKPIIDNIFHNFSYFIQNFNLIQEWLLSDIFFQKYKKDCHPYPSLLNPEKLNDENEEINYNNIPAELAWEMNLPLPDRYKFNLFTFGLTGHSALLRALTYYGVKFQWYSNDYRMLYMDNFKYNYDCLHVLFLNPNDFYKSIKYINLLPKITTIFLIRDPISKFKTGLNHGGYKKGCNSYDIIDSSIPIWKIIDRVEYPFMKKMTISHMLNFWINNGVWYYDSIIKNICTDKIYFLDMEKLMPDKILLTFNELKLKFKLNNVDNLEFLQSIVFGLYRYILPIIIKFSFKDTSIKVYVELKDRITNGNINLNNIFKYNYYPNNFLQDVVFSVSKSDFEQLNDGLIKKIKKFQKNFLDILNNKIKDIESKKWSEKNILDELKDNKLLRQKVYNLLNKELNFIRQYYPNVMASWKYFQEFEKICKENDF